MSHRKAKKVRRFLKDKGADWKNPIFKSVYKAIKRAKTIVN
jgi:hypothetical protein